MSHGLAVALRELAYLPAALRARRRSPADTEKRAVQGVSAMLRSKLARSFPTRTGAVSGRPLW